MSGGYYWRRTETCDSCAEIGWSGLRRMQKRSKQPIKYSPSICAEWMPWTDESRLDSLNHVKSMGGSDEALKIFREINCIAVHDRCPLGSKRCHELCQASSKLRLRERLERIRRVLDIVERAIPKKGNMVPQAHGS